MFTTPTFRTVAASGALALVATSGAMLTSPAVAATSETLNYTCTSPALGEFAVTAKHSIPEELVYGGTIAVTTTMTLDEQTVGGLNFFGFKQIDGTAVNNGRAAGLLDIQFGQTIPKTDVPAAGTMDLVADGVVDTAPYAGATTSGQTVNIAMADIDGADITAQLYTYNAEGTQGGPAPVDCELADGQNLNVGDVTVIKAATRTTAKLAYKKKAKKMVAKSILAAPASGAAVVGDVRFTLKRNGKKVGSKVMELGPNQRAKAVFTKIKKKGKYKVVAKFLGDANFDNSKGSAAKKV